MRDHHIEIMVTVPATPDTDDRVGTATAYGWREVDQDGKQINVVRRPIGAFASPEAAEAAAREAATIDPKLAGLPIIRTF
jgi:hypothetical protein